MSALRTTEAGDAALADLLRALEFPTVRGLKTFYGSAKKQCRNVVRELIDARTTACDNASRSGHQIALSPTEVRTRGRPPRGGTPRERTCAPALTRPTGRLYAFRSAFFVLAALSPESVGSSAEDPQDATATVPDSDAGHRATCCRYVPGLGVGKPDTPPNFTRTICAERIYRRADAGTTTHSRSRYLTAVPTSETLPSGALMC